MSGLSSNAAVFIGVLGCLSILLQFILSVTNELAPPMHGGHAETKPRNTIRGWMLTISLVLMAVGMIFFILLIKSEIAKNG